MSNPANTKPAPTTIALPAERSAVLSGPDFLCVQQYILQILASRRHQMGLKPTSKKGLEMQGDFLAGAMTALHAMGLDAHQSMPPSWYIAIMRGDVVEAPRVDAGAAVVDHLNRKA